MPRIFLMRSVHVAPTDEQAHAEAREYAVSGIERIGGGPIAQTRIGWGSHARGMGTDSQRADNLARGQTVAEAARNYDFSVEHGISLVGSPATVIRRLQAGQARLGYDLFCTNHQIGRMPPELVNQSIDLFGQEVIPAFAATPALSS
jgi:alkanesulfonate monooxygenase SsuD/methylene tetrahydromethanopterin reductase-like flavin-dependent oxidoreductase (luciferase family)